MTTRGADVPAGCTFREVGLLQEDHRDLAHSLSQVWTAYGNLGQHQQHLDFSQQAMAIEQRLFPDDDPDVASSLNNVR